MAQLAPIRTRGHLPDARQCQASSERHGCIGRGPLAVCARPPKARTKFLPFPRSPLSGESSSSKKDWDGLPNTAGNDWAKIFGSPVSREETSTDPLASVTPRHPNLYTLPWGGRGTARFASITPPVVLSPRPPHMIQHRQYAIGPASVGRTA